jgi:hypothetical protein
MRRTALFALLLALAGCGVPPAGDNMRRGIPSADTSPITPMPAAPPMVTPLTAPAVGYGGSPPAVPSGGLGAEAPMPAPAASRMPTIAAQPGVPPAARPGPAGAGQSIVVPNGNGTSTIIHPDGTVETVPTPK